MAKKKTTAKTPAAKAAAAKKVAAKKAALARRGGAGRALKGGPKTTAPVIRRGDGSFRLPEDVRPEAYHIHVVPDLNRGIFRGEEIIEITLDRSRSVIQVHAADLELDRAEITPRGEGQTKTAGAPRKPSYAASHSPVEATEFTAHPSRETVEIRFPRSLQPGRYTLSIAYHGALQKRLRGLYAAQSGNRRYAFTQFEAADARRCFPCFDEPAMKARFTFSVTVRSGLTVVSNNPVRRSDHNTNGTTTWHFTQTPPLSTYLCALAVGELESEEQRHLGTVPVRVWHVPGKANMATFALETAIASLQRLERYFNIPYPYEKLDLVAVPDFEAGAMENAGAVFFRETLLLVDPHTITVAEQKRVAEVIAHELAHMWFGNLVTMQWWDDLWLNEAFATWMAFKIIDDWKPEWRMWNNFEPHRSAALGMDALANTHPIYAEVANAAQATENFDAITYEKGASVVRMLESYLGEARFRKGVRQYIAKNAESNAVAADLWKALEKASNQPVEKIAGAWIKQPGFPIVTFARDEEKTTPELAVRQERFKASPTTKVPAGGATSWPLPLVVKVPKPTRGTRMERALVQKARDRITVKGDAAPAWYYGNAAEGGFYRPLHDDECLASLTENFQSHLEPVERMGLAGHQWAIVRAGRAPLSSFLALVDACRHEGEYEVLDTLVGPLSFLDDQVVDAAGPDSREQLHAWLESVFGPARAELGWDAEPDEAQARALRRASLFRLVGVLAENREIAAEASTRLDAYLDDATTLDPNLADSFVSIAAREGDYERFTRMRGAVENTRTPQERRRLQQALGDFRQTRSMEQGLGITLTPEVPTQDVGFLLIRYLSNRIARPLAWAFIQKHWEALGGRLPPMMASRLIEATALLQSKDHRKEVGAFFKEHPVETAARALKLALERFDVNEEFRKRAAEELKDWLDQKAPPSDDNGR
ncbi:MAG: M1 family metallopeptidase [Candidatus Binatia bacterium]|nr:M1 family metallopeptidase [Candidatus Binatia bacterium]